MNRDPFEDFSVAAAEVSPIPRYKGVAAQLYGRSEHRPVLLMQPVRLRRRLRRPQGRHVQSRKQ